MTTRVLALALILSACTSGGAAPAPTTTAGPGSASSATTNAPPTTAPPPTNTGVVVSPTWLPLPVVDRVGDGYRVTTPCESTVTITSGTHVASATVVLDPGHGGDDLGAVGTNGLTESGTNLSVAKLAEEYLEQRGITVVLTRTADYEMTLEARARVARALSPTVFVSVHHNAGHEIESESPGSDMYYQERNAESRRLAAILWEETVAALRPFGGPWYSALESGAKFLRSRRGAFDYYGVLRRTPGLNSVLAEFTYMSNPREASMLAGEEFRRVEALALMNGIVRFLTTSETGSGVVDQSGSDALGPAIAFPNRPNRPREEGGPPRGYPSCFDPPLE